MLSSWLSMIICPVRPRGPGVRSTANRSPPPLRPKAIQSGEPTRPCTGASGAVMTASVAANRHGHGRADEARDVQLVQREQNAADRLVDTFRSRVVVAPVLPPRPRHPVEHLQLTGQRDARACFRGGDLSLGGADG